MLLARAAFSFLSLSVEVRLGRRQVRILPAHLIWASVGKRISKQSQSACSLLALIVEEDSLMS
jgi:hypothetical protein